MVNLLIKIQVIIYAFKECISLAHIKLFLKSRKFSELSNVWHCLYGTYMDKLYWSHKELLHPIDVLQLEFRHQVMNRECYNNGTCIKCGCTVTALQGAKKSCDGNCYPYWVNRSTFATIFTTTRYKQPLKENNYEYETVLKANIVEYWIDKNKSV